MDLNDAIAELRNAKERDWPWYSARTADETQAIINAVLSGQLIPLETCNARVAAMVEAAAGVAINEAMNGNDPRTTIRALTDADAQAALDAMISRARAVKPLVWKLYPRSGGTEPEIWGAQAGPFHYRLYTFWLDVGRPRWSAILRGLSSDGIMFEYPVAEDLIEEFEDAKAAAQADYTARIHATLRANATDASEGER